MGNNLPPNGLREFQDLSWRDLKLLMIIFFLLRDALHNLHIDDARL